ncbi:BZ3500_MvSof-1268-A1-R1_Chr12-1g03649 [Microbotryum saponariae]|uniref:BZ3500_MvSof-1268-A1-R1_Chr12-1g03649 protein n=1 Tax=Microbotryum saponariae TaxID=289078 RepID=A0A2X0MQP6_9BASI|nr:BZ3500_MvSof-1268-A1-R1_Chr12-1g03649 [Microbotryum saponariae]SDA05242.1 BZ3501_MvSof-1269-A2-R1_Chr12-1g03226 [Microbotryum saponariae]
MLLGSSTSLLVGWLAFATAVRGLAIPGYPVHSPFGASGASKHALVTKCKKPKQFAMTFDDGPDHPGAVIADLFTQHGVKTTFFVNGYNWGCIYDFADEIIRRHKAGHTIASHTWSHVDITKMAPDALAQQLDLVDEAPWKIIGVKPKFFRPPYGKHNAASIKAVKARNMTTIMWSFSSEDAVGKTPEQSLKEYGSLMKHFPAPEIALNHEIKEGTAQTVVPHILLQLIVKGYKLVTVDECLGVEPYREVGTPGVRDATWTCSGTPRPGQRR